MLSPLPIDPYTVLGVQKDANISAIRSSYRKLVLKYHPDRIKNESERADSLVIFRDVVDAYAILSDDSMRWRYDAKVKFAQLRKEAMAGKDAAEAAPTSKGFDFQKRSMYEEREPRSAYHNSGKVFMGVSARNYDYDETMSSTRRVSSRTYAEFEPRPSARRGEKERSGKRDEKATISVPLDAAITSSTSPSKTMKVSKEKAREKEKAQERERRAQNRKTRDREKRRQPSDKPTARYAVFISDSDSDAPVHYRRSSATPRPAYTENVPARSRTPEYIPRNSSTRHRVEYKENSPSASTQRSHRYTIIDDAGSQHRSWQGELPRDRPVLYRSPTNPQPKTPKRPEPQHSRSNESRGRGFWGSDPGSPGQPRPRASSVCSHTSSRNGSLRGHARFDADYQHPTYSRPRAGSAASGGSAGSRYDIDRRSPGLPPMPRPSPKRVIAEPLYESQWSRKPSTHARELDRRSRHERPLSDHARYARLYASSSISSQEDKVLLPGPPRTHTAVLLPSPAPCEPLMPETEKSSRAECDICGLEIEINRKRDWQKHIFEDLRPYQCLETSCQSASETFSSCTKLLKHMKEQHPNSELLTVKELACPFCQEELPEKKQQRLKHLGGHMEEIALSAITGAFEEDWKFYSDSEKNLSSVCGQEPRQHKDPLESKNLPSLTSAFVSAPEAPTVERTEAKTASTISRQASRGQPSELVVSNDQEYLPFKSAGENKREQRQETRRAPSADPAKVLGSPKTAKADVLDTPSPSKLDKDLTNDDNLSRSSSKQRLSHTANDFIQKLNRVLEDHSYSTIVRRGKDGHSVVMLEKEKFAKSVLPIHFKHNSFPSFVRQLNKHGFHKVDDNNDEGATSIYGPNALEFRSSSVGPAGNSHHVLRRTKKFARPSAVFSKEPAPINREAEPEREVTHQFVEKDPPVQLKPSQPRSKINDAKVMYGVVDTSKDRRDTSTEARKPENRAYHKQALKAYTIATPKPPASSTVTSEQTSRDQSKKDRPRLERNGGASSWDSWTASPSARKAKKTSTPSANS